MHDDQAGADVLFNLVRQGVELLFGAPVKAIVRDSADHIDQ
jgi:hypothetical protein